MKTRAEFKQFLTVTELNWFEPKICEAVSAYKWINQFVFKNKLTRPKIEIRPLKGMYGWCFADLSSFNEPFFKPFCNKIVLTNKFPNKTLFFEVVAHEMVHQYQAEHFNKMDHGASFFVWKQTLAEFDIKLRKML